MSKLPETLDETGIPSLVGRAVGEARALASAEIALLRAKVTERIGAYRGAAVYFVAAAIMALCGLVALLVGLILTLATVIGPGFATLAVTVVVFGIAGVLALIGKRRLSPAVPS